MRLIVSDFIIPPLMPILPTLTMPPAALPLLMLTGLDAECVSSEAAVGALGVVGWDEVAGEACPLSFCC